MRFIFTFTIQLIMWVVVYEMFAEEFKDYAMLFTFGVGMNLLGYFNGRIDSREER